MEFLFRRCKANAMHSSRVLVPHRTPHSPWWWC